MIQGMHAMFYTEKPEEMRAFFRDTLELPATDVGDGWLIFDAPEADLGCHPADAPSVGISFYCEDIEATVAALREKGVEFAGEIRDEGWGLAVGLELPDGSELQLFEPKYEK